MTNEISYFNNNVILGFDNWNLLNGASLVDNKIHLISGGYASITLSDQYFLGLNACYYRKLEISLSTTILEIYNYRNILEAILEGVYINNENEEIPFRYNVSFTKLDNTIGTVSYQSREIKMLGFTLKSMKLIFVNHSDYDVDLISVAMYRSQDISTDQVAGSIGYGSGLVSGFVAYNNGWLVNWANSASPMTLEWSQNENNQLNGVKINGDRFVSFSRVNESLPQLY